MASTESNKNITKAETKEEVKAGVNTEIEILELFFPSALGLLIQGYKKEEELEDIEIDWTYQADRLFFW